MVQISDYRALLSGYSWYQQNTVGRPVFLTYSFDTAIPAYARQGGSLGTSTLQPLSEAEKVVVRAALDDWARVSGVTFFETTKSQGDLTFAFYDFNTLAPPTTAAGTGYYPSTFSYAQSGANRVFSGETLVGGDVYFSSSYRQEAHFMSDLKHLALHEVGHALGLKHPFDVEVGHEETLTIFADKGDNTVMSYDSTRASQLGPFDIAAIQHLYGTSGQDGAHVASFEWNAGAERLTQVGTAAAELLRGTGAADVIHSMGGRDAIYTAQGRDRIILTGQAAEVNGGSDLDTVVTGVAVFNRAALSGSDGLRSVRLSDGTFQTLVDVERIAFGDVVMAFDSAGTAGQLYRMYQAAFDRTPDRSGLTFNLSNYENLGFSLKDMANFFVKSPEFSRLYGANSTDTAFINAMYGNVLNRAPDSGGLAFYQERLGSGVWDRASVLAGFSESPENIAAVAPSIVGGIALDTSFLVA